jgi:DNA repair exonuclease SbcCD ATPase subunit
MIIGKIRFKNFFSSGNSFVEIDLRTYKSAAIIGTNGEGKSTLFNAIMFVLFNKTIKSVTKAQIVNSINNKNCLVEIEFVIDSKEYLVRRGIKPNIFEIYENSVLVDQTVVGDYQQYLEEKILKSSYRTFLQTSIISIENYKPFMSLPAGERRDFIEDILDIQVFSIMNKLVKTKNTKNIEELKLLDLRMKGLMEKITIIKTHIEKIEDMQKTGIESIDEKIETAKNEIELAQTVVETTEKELLDLKPIQEELAAKKKELQALQNRQLMIKTKISQLDREIKSLDLSDTCPTCSQGIDNSSILEILRVATSKKTELTAEMEALYPEFEQYDPLDDEVEDLQDKLTSKNAKISIANSTVTRMLREIKNLESEKKKLTESEDVSSEKAELKVLAKEGIDLRSRIATIKTEQDYNAVMLELFKDSGIKSKIVEQYIPVINKLANKYLEKLDFFVSFNLDSEFKEVIKSRHRDIFTYNSFSAGEKQRIDLALLFTFRELARQKNSFLCNLFALDELIDASIDSAGIDLLMDIFNSDEFKDSNILVISHRDKEALEDSFNHVYTVRKRDGFSEFHS